MIYGGGRGRESEPLRDGVFECSAWDLPLPPPRQRQRPSVRRNIPPGYPLPLRPVCGRLLRCYTPHGRVQQSHAGLRRRSGVSRVGIISPGSVGDGESSGVPRTGLGAGFGSTLSRVAVEAGLHPASALPHVSPADFPHAPRAERCDPAQRTFRRSFLPLPPPYSHLAALGSRGRAGGRDGRGWNTTDPAHAPPPPKDTIRVSRAAPDGGRRGEHDGGHRVGRRRRARRGGESRRLVPVVCRRLYRRRRAGGPSA